MSSNIHEFTAGVKRAGEEMPDELVEKRHRAVALEGLKGLVRMTPVDTGRARANWQVSQGTPAMGEVDALDKGGSRTIASGGGAISQAEAFSVTYIANNLPYIEELEGGSSTQAPAGMLYVTFGRLKAWLGRQR